MKLGAGMAFTVSETEVELVKLPEEPVIVTFTVPVAAVLLALSVNVLVLVVLAGLNEAVTPLGRPEAVRLTVPVKPFCGSTEIVVVPLVPCVSVTLFGEDDRPKLGIGVEPGQLLTRLAAFTVPMPVAKSHPTVVA